VNRAHSNHPQFWYSSGGCARKTIRSFGSVGGYMTKLQNILYYVFILMPICFVCGLGIILIDNKAVVNFQFEIKKFKTRKQIDKDKFKRFMNRVCK
jgi:hypothetical protein